MLNDLQNRNIDYLRLSVTEDCNLRCVYCLPEKHTVSSPTGEMRDEEIVTIVRMLASFGITKLRITGGEPLLKNRLCDLVFNLSSIKGIKDIAMTTNGVLLNRYAKNLKDAGLKRVNISLDSLNRKKFKEIARLDRQKAVMDGIESAIQYGLNPVKINVVVFKGINDHEIKEFVALTKKFPVHVRFIEAMPIGQVNYFTLDNWISFAQMSKLIPDLIALPYERYPTGNGPAIYYEQPNSLGTVGFISALSKGFCSSCNRIRLSSKGVLFPCLDSNIGIDLKMLLKKGSTRKDLKKQITDTLNKKPAKHVMQNKVLLRNTNKRNMCQLGG